MRYPKYYLYLTGDEYRLTLDALIQRKNKLQRIGKHTDPLDEVIIKLGKAKHKRIRVKTKAVSALQRSYGVVRLAASNYPHMLE